MLRTAAVGAGFGAAMLAGFRWWERWDREQVCTGIFADCVDQTLGPVWVGGPLLVVAAWLCLLVLGVPRRWLVVVIALPLNALAAVAAHAVEPRIVAVVVVSAASWALAGLVAARRPSHPSSSDA